MIIQDNIESIFMDSYALKYNFINIIIHAITFFLTLENIKNTFYLVVQDCRMT